MTDLVLAPPHIPASSPAALDAVRRLEARALQFPQVPIATQHVFHAGLYARTVRIPAGVMITGAEVTIATLLIVQGDVDVWLDGETQRIVGYAVLAADGGRKQAFKARADTTITMVFPTTATTVADAERAFTEEADRLASRGGAAENRVGPGLA